MIGRMTGFIDRLFRSGNAAAGKVICHIGPPKTATTTLQSALQDAPTTRVRYIGTMQPRSRNAVHGAYSALMSVISADEPIQTIEEVRGTIRQALRSGRDVILSEEMLLVSGSVSFEEKLKRLRDCLDFCQCEILLTLREPVSAVRSFYSEIYFRQKLEPRIGFEEFLASDQAHVFDYPHLLARLKALGFDETRCVLIEKGNDRIELSRITGRPEHDQMLRLKVLNQSEAPVRKQTDSLQVPPELKAHLTEGYVQTLGAYGLGSEKVAE